MPITALTDLSSTYGDEYGEFQDLFIKGALRTSLGVATFTSLTSGVTYDTSTSSDPNILNKGENGLLYWLGQIVLKNSLMDATWITALIQAIVKSDMVYGTDGGASDAYAISLPTAPTAYTLGSAFMFRANTANTAACSLNVNGLGAIAIKDINGADLATGAILVNQMVSVIYNGTYFIMVSDAPLQVNKKLTTPTITAPIIQNWDGWMQVTDSWSYASANTITVPTGAASHYKIGGKIKLTQTTVKYFSIVAVADTLLTVTGGSSYTVANAAISSIYYSFDNDPLGFPDYFSLTTPTWTTTGTAFTNQPISQTWYIKIFGKTVNIFGQMLMHSTSGGTGNFRGAFSSTEIPLSLIPNVGSSMNVTTAIDGFASMLYNTRTVSIGKYDSSTLATNNEYIYVDVDYKI